MSQVLLALNQYTSLNDGRYPPPDQVAECLIANGHISPSTLNVATAPANEASYFFVTPQRTEFRDVQPVVYTNPSLARDGSISVGFSDNSVNRLSPIQARAFLTSVSPRAIPIK